MTAALIPALIEALGLAGAGAAAYSTKKMLDENSSKSKVLYDGLNGSLADTVSKKIKDAISTKVFQQNLNTFLIDAVASGAFDSKDAKNIAESGYITKEQYMRLPKELQRRLAKLTGEDLDKLIANLPDPDPNNNKDDDDKKKKKKDEQEKKVRRAVKEAKNQQGEDEYFEPKEQRSAKAAENRARWGEIEQSSNAKTPKEDSARITNDSTRYVKREMTPEELADHNNPSNRASRLQARENHNQQVLKDALKADKKIEELGLEGFIKSSN